jgi:nucleotide-binding universal stress UspA family protein
MPISTGCALMESLDSWEDRWMSDALQGGTDRRMAATSVLLPVSTWPDATPAAGLLRAFDIAASLGATITAVLHEVDIPAVTSFMGESLVNVTRMITSAEKASAASADRLGAQLRALAGRFHAPLQVRRWRGRLDDAPAHFTRSARTCDHTFLVPLPGDANQRAIAEAVLFGSGGPLWVFPDEEATAHLKTISIAWDGGRAAARAVRDALPILRQADDVTIVSISDDKPIDGASLDALHSYLEVHGIAAVSVRIERGEQPVGEALQAAAVASGAGLLVMGGYGHSRLREFALGGATRSVLGGPVLPVLLSH